MPAAVRPRRESVEQRAPQEVRVLEYRQDGSEDYFLVEWNDGVQTWTRAGLLSRKDLLIDFARHCRSILLKEQEAAQKEAEEQLLKQLLGSAPAQAQPSQSVPASGQQAPVSLATALPSRAKPASPKSRGAATAAQPTRGWPSHGASPNSLNSPNGQAPPTARKPAAQNAPSKNATPSLSSLQRKRVSLPSSGPLPHQPAVVPRGSACAFTFQGRPVAEYTVFIAPTAENVQISLEGLVFVSFGALVPRLSWLARCAPAIFGVHPLSCLQQSSAVTGMLKRVQEEGLAGVTVLGPSTAILAYAPAWLVPAGPTGPPLTLFLLSRTYTPDLVFLANLLESQRQERASAHLPALWDEGTYKTLSSAESATLINTTALPAGRAVYFISDNSAIAKHAQAALQQRAQLVSACTDAAAASGEVTVLVHSAFFHLLHSIPAATACRRAKKPLYGLLGTRVVELLRPATMHLLGTRAIGECDAKMLTAFLDALEETRHDLRIDAAAWLLLENRLKSDMFLLEAAKQALLKRLQKRVFKTKTDFEAEARQAYAMQFVKLAFLGGPGATVMDAMMRL